MKKFYVFSTFLNSGRLVTMSLQFSSVYHDLSLDFDLLLYFRGSYWRTHLYVKRKQILYKPTNLVFITVTKHSKFCIYVHSNNTIIWYYYFVFAFLLYIQDTILRIWYLLHHIILKFHLILFNFYIWCLGIRW